MKAWKIVAELDATEANTTGYSVYNYFRSLRDDNDRYEGDVLDMTFSSEEAADCAARITYKGLDCDGVGCMWRIEPID